ncbi:MAG: hypothetical protein AB7T07_12140 [Steroidobacteraceae bacterium]
MLRNAIKILVFAGFLAMLMTAIRLYLIEPDEVARSCTADAGQWRCRVRDLLVQGFVHHLYGAVSLIAAVLAWLSGFAALAVLAMIAGMAGAVLYDFDLAGLGLLIGALSLMRYLSHRQLSRQQPAASDQQTAAQ